MALFLLAAVALAGQSSIARPQYVGGWLLSKVDDSCVIERMQATTINVALSIYTKRPNDVTIVINNPSWKSLIADKTYPVELSMGTDIFNVVAAGFLYEGKTALVIRVSREFLTTTLVENKPVTVRFNNVVIANIPRGSGTAYQSLLQCVAASEDPFAPDGQK